MLVTTRRIQAKPYAIPSRSHCHSCKHLPAVPQSHRSRVKQLVDLTTGKMSWVGRTAQGSRWCHHRVCVGSGSIFDDEDEDEDSEGGSIEAQLAGNTRRFIPAGAAACSVCDGFGIVDCTKCEGTGINAEFLERKFTILHANKVGKDVCIDDGLK
ncbi:hypothetical protein CYMTET_20937 [Cymbomonas tetramitiformis]|uniref:Uncharacterized protein n=1 Tax=Cymbomonas tetramitiformis TaxID=36881 RepID=A0AAE0L3N3_9CHLO|nr:hypothetical protein CYMTET_20937 [Cymbomonas tetramitiformis]